LRLYYQQLKNKKLSIANFKYFSVKKVLVFLLAMVASTQLNAQTCSFNVLTTPCDSNGVVVATFTGVTPPFGVQWYTNAGYKYDSIITGYTDTLYHFVGGTIQLNLSAPPFGTFYYYADSTLPFSVNPTLLNGTCPGLGSGSVEITGGTAPFTCYWTNAGTGASYVGNPAALPAGYYTVKVVDATGCMNGKFDSYYNHVSVSLDYTDTIATTSAICPGIGTATISTIGGTAPFSYIWKNSSGTIIATVNPMSLPAGDYRAKVIDALGCSDSFYFAIYYTPDFSVAMASSPAICPALGSASATVTGGSTPFTYQWKNSIGTIVGTTDPISVPAGNYQVNVTDGLGCVDSAGIIVGYVSDFMVSMNVTPAICPALGSATPIITGGTAPFSFVWTNSSGVVVGSATSVSEPAGLYILTITDALGCTNTLDSVHISYVADFTATVSTTPSGCLDGTATATIIGGTAPFSYIWNTGATSASITGLMPGGYSVSITDAIGCTSVGSIYGYVNSSVTITVSNITTPTYCVSNTGWQFATVYGGTPPYSYLWNNGATTDTITGLNSGTYDVTVTDAHGCIGLGYGNISTIVPLGVSPATITPSACTSATGSATLTTITGGTPPYTVEWFTSPAQYGMTATGLAAGSYDLKVTDATGCMKITSVYIPNIYTYSVGTTTYPAHCTLADGSIVATPLGGVSPYTFAWTSGWTVYSATTATLSSVTSGSYEVTVTDANGCKAYNDDYVPFSSPITLGLSSTPASCLFANNGTITATATMGTPPYTYSMGGVSSGSVTITGLTTNNYFINVTDAAGCTSWAYSNVDYNHADSSCFCTIKGNVFRDLNDNCLQETGEPNIPSSMVQLSGYDWTFTDMSGYYSFIVPSGSYTLTETLPSGYALSTCQPYNIPLTVTASAGCSVIKNFSDTLIPVTPYHDLYISSWDFTRPVKGYPYTQITVIANNGTDTETTIIAKYKTNGTIYAPTSIVPSGYYTGSGLEYTATGLPALVPEATQSYLMSYLIPASVPAGTILVFNDTVASSAPISNWIHDSTPWNNVDYFNPWVHSSFDPNFKEVKPEGTGPLGYISVNDSVLQYMIHFQNTGTFMAQNIVVKDTLDPNLDWQTLKPVFMDHKGRVDVNPNTGAITFTFNNIDLPDANSEPITSNAVIIYTIKQKKGLSIGTQIKNRASIYFDFNVPVQTQSTLNTIWFPAQVNEINQDINSSFTLYPNPANSSFTTMINNLESCEVALSITDISGRLLITKKMNLEKGVQQVVTDVNGFTSGVYLVTLIANGKTATEKLVILK
jgi:uncharacterized repeat protein (TIGR01451 family)